MEPEEAHARLTEVLSGCEDGLLVAMSGGVDSCTLAYFAIKELQVPCLAVTLDAESSASEEIEAAASFAANHDLDHRIVAHSELADPAYVKNDGSRCYHCRQGMAERLSEVAKAEGFGTIAMGVLTDDYGEHRPGIQAADEAGIWFPYVEAGLGKQAVRSLADHLGLEVADRPANACLSSRISYGLEVTEERLRQVEAAERAVREVAGVAQVRVRHHGEVARIEVSPQERQAVLDNAKAIAGRVKEAGFTYVSMDLVGYRSGSMNAVLGTAGSST